MGEFVLNHAVHAVVTGLAVKNLPHPCIGSFDNGQIPLEVAYSLDVVVVNVGEEEQVHPVRCLGSYDSGQLVKAKVPPQDVAVAVLIGLSNREIDQIIISACCQAIQLTQQFQLVVIEGEEVEQPLHAVLHTRRVTIVMCPDHDDAVILLADSVKMLPDAASHQIGGVIQAPEHKSLALLTHDIGFEEHSETRYDVETEMLKNEYQCDHCR